MSNQIQSPNIKKFDIKTFGIDLTFGFWILIFFSLLSFLIPLSVSAAPAQYNFPLAILSPDGAVLSETIVALPFDAIGSASAVDLGNDGTDELLITAGVGFEPLVILLRQDGSEINSWLAYNKNFRGGIKAAVGDVAGDARPEIITAPASGGGPQVWIFNGFGSPLTNFFVGKKNFRGTTEIAMLPAEGNKKQIVAGRLKTGKVTRWHFFDGRGQEVNPKVAFVPPSEPPPEEKKFPKKLWLSLKKDGENVIWELSGLAKIRAEQGKLITIDLSDQKLSYFQDGFRINSFLVSTGRWNFPTPIGEFAIQNKIPRAYSRRYNLYMPWWMAFYQGQYGIHELPEWANGAKEGENHLGTPVSHGCIRLGVGPAKTLYDWARVGTRVIVQK